MLLKITGIIKNMTNTYRNLFFILAALTLISSCGFRPLGTKSLPPQLHQVYYQPEHLYGQFEVTFKKRLEAYGIVLVSEPKATAPTIHAKSNYTSNNNNPASSTQARIYNLTYSATISVSDFHNQPLLGPQTASVTRSVSLLPNEIFETTPQIEIIKQEMMQDLSIKLLNILSSRKTFLTLKNLAT